MDIIISNSSNISIYEQIYSQIKNMIINNTLKEGDALPSMRLLAKELRISVITTKRAYEELERDGFIETITGKGSFIAKKNVEFIMESQLRSIEEYIQKAINIAKNTSIDIADLHQMMDLLYKEQ